MGARSTEPLAFTAPEKPAVDSSSVTDVSSAFADLHAEIDPLGAATSYRFEYSSDGVTWVDAPVPDGEIGSGGPSGSAEANVAQQVGPLQPGTAYTFRVSATSEIEGRPETTVGPEATFETLAATPEGLPDGRAYELVTPPNKGSAEDMFAAHRSNTTYMTMCLLSVIPLNRVKNSCLKRARRSARLPLRQGTCTSFGVRARAGLTPRFASPALGVQEIAKPVFDPESFAQVAFLDDSGSTASVGGVHALNLLGPAGGPYAQISSEALSVTKNVVVNGHVVAPSEIVGASRDLGDVILESPDHTLLSEDETQDEGSQALYEYANGGLKLASVEADGSPFPCGAELGGKSQDSNNEVAGTGQRHNAVSADGAKVFFTAPDPQAQNDGPGCWNGAGENAPQIYMRSGGATVEVSAPASRRHGPRERNVSRVLCWRVRKRRQGVLPHRNPADPERSGYP